MGHSENSCGLSSWRPQCLQRFATSRTFIAVFGLLGTIQAMAFVYFIATLTTLEKRFQMRSQTMGIVMSGNEISQIMLVLVLSYLGGKGNRPVWIGWGVAISALSCFILASPHFIFGPGQAALALTSEFLDVNALNTTIKGKDPFVCKDERESEDCSEHNVQGTLTPVILLFLSQFVLGIGTSLYFSLGQTYMDDNTNKTKTPMLLGVTMALRTLGPACGFLLGSLCLSLYIDPTLTPLIGRKDPRWLGAWWLGWVILGGTMLVFALILGTFPKTLPRKRYSFQLQQTVELNPIYEGKRHKEDDIIQESDIAALKERKKHESSHLVTHSTKDGETFLKCFKRLITNPILAVNNFTAVFYILGASGYMSFYNKYTETQFEASVATSNIVAAVSTIFSLVVGFLLSGFVISRFKPRTSYLLMWNVVIGCVYVSGELFIMSLHCPDTKMEGNFTDGTLNPNLDCNWNCSCESLRYSPVCDYNTRTTYFSACHAGCADMSMDSSGKTIFTHCGCIEDPSAIITQGPCLSDCGSNLYIFMAAVCLMQMIGCTGRITNVLINYRSVLPQDKAMTQGLALFLISLFAFIPGPILYGKIIDHACLIWDNTCGEKGNCWLYDKTKFRIYMNSTAAGFSSVAVVLDVVLWFLGRTLNLYVD